MVKWSQHHLPGLVVADLEQTASSSHVAFDALLEMYERIGVSLPQLEQYQDLFQSNAHMRTILHLLYADILRFHKKALKFFKHPGTWSLPFYTNEAINFGNSVETAFPRSMGQLESQV
jgi:hypothetical protein